MFELSLKFKSGLISSAMIFFIFLFMALFSFLFTWENIDVALMLSIALALCIPFFFVGYGDEFTYGYQGATRRKRLDKRVEAALIAFVMGGPTLFIFFNIPKGVIYTLTTANTSGIALGIFFMYYSFRSWGFSIYETWSIPAFFMVANSIMKGLTTLNLEGTLTLILFTLVPTILVFIFYPED